MKTLITVFSTICITIFNCHANNIENDCTYRGIALYGKVKIVRSFADIQVKVVNSFADLHVKKVGSFANNCGEWKFVDSFPDFTIELVDAFADIEIQFVDSFPGLRD